MRCQHFGRQRKIALVGRPAALAPTAHDRRHPARLSRTGVPPPNGVDVPARAEERGIELHLLLRLRPGVHRPWRPVEPCCLRTVSRRRLDISQPQQPTQARVLPSQALELVVDIRHNCHPAESRRAPAGDRRVGCLVVSRKSAERARELPRDTPSPSGSVAVQKWSDPWQCPRSSGFGQDGPSRDEASKRLVHLRGSGVRVPSAPPNLLGRGLPGSSIQEQAAATQQEAQHEVGRSDQRHHRGPARDPHAPRGGSRTPSLRHRGPAYGDDREQSSATPASRASRRTCSAGQ